MGPPVLLPPPDGRCAADFFKNPSPRLGLNQRPLGPVARTLITAPTRQLHRRMLERIARQKLLCVLRRKWTEWSKRTGYTGECLHPFDYLIT
jgi:hypothetical protein